MSYEKLAREEVLGRYRLIARLGHGGMADVFLARLAGAGDLEQLVAVKRMLSNRSGDRRSVALFLNEGRIAAQLDHPNICRVYELGEADDTLFLAMEFLHGLPWSEIVPAIPDHPQHTLVRFVTGAIAQACEGLHHAHTAVGPDGQPRPIVHRDVSPSNLFVTTGGVVKLLDFGVSTVISEATAPGRRTLKGKLPYIAPEQLQRASADVRADVFSLAVVTWEALAGRPLFGLGSSHETMKAVARTDVPALPGKGPVIAELDAILRRALARDRTARPGSVRELAGELRRAIAVYGEPMPPAEIQAQISTWLQPSLARKHRDLAELIGNGPPTEHLSGERTFVHMPALDAGVRLRDVPIVVGNDALETARTRERRLPERSADARNAPVPPRRPPQHWAFPLTIALAAIAVGLAMVLIARAFTSGR
ncbi:MAG TPA: serine/threonine-protein kinase [Kofleriaceae bacterium]